MDRFAREDLWTVLRQHGVQVARRVADSDATEEIILLDAATYDRVDQERLCLDLMAVLPHIKVWVVPDGPWWTFEPL